MWFELRANPHLDGFCTVTILGRAVHHTLIETVALLIRLIFFLLLATPFIFVRLSKAKTSFMHLLLIYYVIHLICSSILASGKCATVLSIVEHAK